MVPFFISFDLEGDLTARKPPEDPSTGVGIPIKRGQFIPDNPPKP